MLSRNLLITSLLLAASLAGCAEGMEAVQSNEPSYDEFELEASEDTGVIRGVVVDPSITPIAGAIVTIQGDETRETTTNEEGAFGFKDLNPGFHSLLVDKDGYGGVTQQVEVVAGVDQPPVVRVLLEEDPSELPVVNALTFNGYIDCSVSTPAYRVAVCSLPGASSVTDDNFMKTHSDLDAGATFIQAEMIWRSTQAAGDRMSMTMEAGCAADGCDVNGPEQTGQGESPIVLFADTERLNAEEQRYEGVLLHRVFNMEVEGTAPPVPVCDVPNPIHGGTMCVKGWGATLQQKFTIYTHVFSRSVPQEGWQFSVDGEPQLNPAPA